MKIFFYAMISGILFLPVFLMAQDAHNAPTDNVLLNESFFTDGVYFTLSDLQQHKPSVSKEQLFKSTIDNSNFSIGQWAGTQNLFYFDSEGVKRKLSRDSLWGYVENGTPYIFLNDRFHRFSAIGPLSIFKESYPSIQAGLAPVVTEANAGTTINLFVLSTGEITELTPDHVAAAIEDNQSLYDEFKSLKSGKIRRKKMYRFVERYNDQKLSITNVN